MYTATWMLAGVLLSAAPGAPEPVPPPRLEKGLEITWTGQYTEATLTPSKIFRTFSFKARAFVLDVSPAGSDVAIMTTLQFKPEVKTNPNDIPPIQRLEIVRIDPRGAPMLLPGSALIHAPEKRIAVAFPLQNLQGLPSYETGMFMALPKGDLKVGTFWDVPEENRPARNWKLEGAEFIQSGRCIKAVGIQQTADFDRAAITRPQWRRGDVVWISDRTGYACKVERVIEKRDPDGRDLSFRSKLVYEHPEQLIYRGRLYDDQKEEIVTAAILGAELQDALGVDRKPDPPLFDRIVRQIEQFEQIHTRGEYVPYREAVLTVKRRAEAARQGHIPPAPPPAETAEPSTLIVGRPAPDFLAMELVQNQAIRLSRLKGKPVVLLYYQPAGKGAELILKLAQSLFTSTDRKAYILSVAIGDAEEARKQRDDGHFTIPILAGKEIYKLHGVASTPQVVIIDDSGVVRKVFVGWRDETVDEVRKELEKWVK